MADDATILALARKHLDACVCFGTGNLITRATDAELLAFARAVLAQGLPRAVDVRCAACDKPAVTTAVDGTPTFPTCPCGSKAFNATTGKQPAEQEPPVAPADRVRVFMDLEHGGLAFDRRRAPPARQPLPASALKAHADALFAADTEFHNVDTWFERGVRYAESAHGVTAPASPAAAGGAS